DHGGGHKRFLTGRDPREPTGFVNDYPMVGSLVAKVRDRHVARVPNYVAGVDAGRQGIDVFSFGSAYLGPATHPCMVVGDPSDMKCQVKNLEPAQGLKDRLPDRVALLHQFDRAPRALDSGGTMVALDGFQERALHLITSDQAREAFDLTREPDRLR